MPAAKGPKTVTLVHPDGHKVQLSSPLEISRLHYGLGYAFDQEGQTFTQAVESLGEDVTPTEQVDPDAPDDASTEQVTSDTSDGNDGPAPDAPSSDVLLTDVLLTDTAKKK